MKYTVSFDEMINQYTRNIAEQNQPHRIYRNQGLVDHIVENHLRQLMIAALTGKYDKVRIQAIQKLGKWGKFSQEVQILTRLSENEPSLKIRAAAVKALGQLQKKRIA